MDDFQFEESPRFLNILQSGTGKNACAVSRREILEWVNDWFDKDYRRLEELKTGVEYCCLLNELIPQSVPIGKIRMDTLSDYDCTENWNLIYTCLNTHGVAKELAIDRLASGGSRESLDFAQWFKTFFDRNTEYILHKANQTLDQPTTTTKKIGEGRESLYLVEPVIRSATQPNMRYGKGEDAKAGGPSKQTRNANANARRMHSVSPAKAPPQKSPAKDAPVDPKKRLRFAGKSEDVVEEVPQKKTQIVKRMLREAQRKLELERSAAEDVEVEEEVVEVPPKVTPILKKRLRPAEKKAVRVQSPSEDVEVEEEVVEVLPKKILKKRLRGAQKKLVFERSPSQDVEEEEVVVQVPQKKTQIQKRRLRDAQKKPVPERSPSEDVEVEEEVVEVPQTPKKRVRDAKKKAVPDRRPSEDVEVEEEVQAKVSPKKRIVRKRMQMPTPGEDLEVEGDLNATPRKTRIVRKRVRVHSLSPDVSPNGPAETPRKTLPRGKEQVEEDIEVSPKGRVQNKRMRVHSLSPDYSQKQCGPAEKEAAQVEEVKVAAPPKKSRIPQKTQRRVHSLSPIRSHEDVGKKTLPVPHSLSPVRTKQIEASPERTLPVDVQDVKVRLPPKKTRIPRRRPNLSTSPTRVSQQNTLDEVVVGPTKKSPTPVPQYTKEPLPEPSPYDDGFEVIFPPRHLRKSMKYLPHSDSSNSSNSSSSTIAPPCTRKYEEMEDTASTGTLRNSDYEEMTPFDIHGSIRESNRHFSCPCGAENNYNRKRYDPFSIRISTYYIHAVCYESGNDSVEYNNVNFDREPDECTWGAALFPLGSSHMHLERRPSDVTTLSGLSANPRLEYQRYLKISRTTWQQNHFRKQYYEKRSQSSRSKYLGLRPLSRFAGDLLEWTIDDEKNDPFDTSHFGKYSYKSKSLLNPSTDPNEPHPDEEFRVSTQPQETDFGIYARKLIAALKGSIFAELRTALYNSEIIPYLEYSFVCIVMYTVI